MLHKFNEVQPDTYIRRYMVGNVKLVFMLDAVGICKRDAAERLPFC